MHIIKYRTVGNLFSSLYVLLKEYKFPVYTLGSCPKNNFEWKTRSARLNCTNRNGYMCLPDENITNLIEFCYSGPAVAVPKGEKHIRLNSE